MAETLQQILDDIADEISPSTRDQLERRIAALLHSRVAVGVNVGAGWQPISTAPSDGEFLVGLHVWRHDPVTREVTDVYEEQHVIAIDEETGEIAADYDRGWRLQDYEFWKLLDPLPDAPSDVGVKVGVSASSPEPVADTSRA